MTQQEPQSVATLGIREAIKAADLDALRDELHALEAFAVAETKRLREEVDTMKAVVRFAERLKYGRVPPPERQTRPVEKRQPDPPAMQNKPYGVPTLQDKAKVYLEAAGEATLQAIARGLNYENTSYLNARLMDDDRFVKTDKGTWKLQ